jgi:hypothetical protein
MIKSPARGSDKISDGPELAELAADELEDVGEVIGEVAVGISSH